MTELIDTALLCQRELIGCMLLYSEMQGEIITSVTDGDFLDISIRELYQVIKAFWQKHGAVDITCLEEPLKSVGTECCNVAPSMAAWPAVVERVKEFAIKHHVAPMALNMLTPDATINDLRESANKIMRMVSGVEKVEALDMREALKSFLREQNQKPDYIKTGFSHIDNHVFLERGDYVVIGARPSAGKTAFSLKLALNFAECGLRVVFFSLETSPRKLANRLITCHCGFDFGDVKRRLLSDDERLEHLGDDLLTYKIDLVKAAGRTIQWMRSEAIRRGADVVIIDYAQLVRSAGKSRYEIVTNTSLEIAEFSRAENMLVIALCQINREGSDTPNLRDLKESGQLEQDADVALLLHDEQKKRWNPIMKRNDITGKYRVIIAKNKEGSTGRVAMRFDGEKQNFFELDAAHGEDDG